MELHGRDPELAAVDRLLAHARDRRGGAVVVRGHPGIGKTMVLSAARRSAEAAGMTVLTTNGAEAESALPFAGLHQLLAPLLGDLPALTPRLQSTLRGAFGLQDSRPDLFTVGLAVLELLGDRAARTPLLIVAEDAHWLDPETLDVLVFVARRLTAEPIAALMAVRAQHTGVLSGTGLSQLLLAELDAEAAGRVLADHAPGLAPGLRDRILAEAAGNPLALVELPRVLTVDAGELLPLNERLESAFADRYAQLPAPTRAVVAAFSADTGCALPALLAAARALTGAPVQAGAIQPAIDAGLVQIQDRRLRFRHPLVRSAVYRAAGDIARLTLHAALADGLADDPDRRAWHRSAATLGTDEQVSADLVAAAERALERGALGVAVTDLDRASELTADPARRSSLLLRAAELASQLLDRQIAVRLTGKAESARADPAQGDAADRARLALVREIVDPGDFRDSGRLDLLCDLALAALADGFPQLAATLCFRAASRCWWAGLPPEAGARVTAVLGKLGLAADDPAALAIAAYAQVDVHGPAVLRQLPSLVPDRSDVDGMRFLGGAALILGDFVTASSFMGTATAGYRSQGRAALLARNLSSTGFIRLWLGRWPAVRADLEEAESLAEEIGDHFWIVAARSAQALLEAMCGNHETAVRLADSVLASPLVVGVRFVAQAAQHARGMAANAAGRHDEALDLLLRVFDPSDDTHHPDMCGWALPDLADAAVRSARHETAVRSARHDPAVRSARHDPAVRSARHDAVRAILAVAAERAARFPSPMLHRSLAYAEAVLAPERDAASAYRKALSMDLAAWPVHRARLQLAYGAWLRRERRILESRIPLRAARDGFDALGAAAWGRLAREELRAAGEESAGRATPSGEQLTPQELQTALLAAAGLTNREIGQRLFMSHRTVSSHLYRIFPKLGVTNRAQLRAALDALPHD
ncbi:LuxR family transcriptional regulator [Actinoplanes ianthinogenes]|uniref:LuxR family transcriptional regulator n=1 Tax=Actinoplanes ianthinogenes TaxID=122358 RepID=A0ABN6CPB0_9ACTN|nr:helix-turn-helix transcriptional regulator [Actinoplanes ianthinogenes]BCJ47055.1 LuxR family transcriptional regulator [Actinoplanes ianthinogenes]GGR13606.1 LuxR family transcriptional regulator [Actinoplanes ianthinogenes]